MTRKIIGLLIAISTIYSGFVFETHQLNDSWDGIYKGLQQSTGGFVWMAEEIDIHGNAIKDKGTVMLIR